MDILNMAIQREGSVGKLARALGVRQNVVSNWRFRGVPRPWQQVLRMRYGTEPQAAPVEAEPAGQGA